MITACRSSSGLSSRRRIWPSNSSFEGRGRERVWEVFIVLSMWGYGSILSKKILSVDRLLVKRTEHMCEVKSEWMREALFEVPRP